LPGVTQAQSTAIARGTVAKVAKDANMELPALTKGLMPACFGDTIPFVARNIDYDSISDRFIVMSV
jgi:hypothetical protein